jgi:N utilization substance protein B
MRANQRRRSREAALRALYQFDVGKGSAEDALNSISETEALPAEVVEFAQELVRGVLSNLSTLDSRLEGIIPDYDYGRLAVVDRNVLRIAAWELDFDPSVPPAVSINEAVEVAKNYSTAESGRFVNGVLGRYVRTSAKADWKRSEPYAEEPGSGDAQFDEDEPPKVVTEVVDEGSPEAEVARRFGNWTSRGESE